MADNSFVDLLDEVNCADFCEAVISLCELVDRLVEHLYCTVGLYRWQSIIGLNHTKDYDVLL